MSQAPAGDCTINLVGPHIPPAQRYMVDKIQDKVMTTLHLSHERGATFFKVLPKHAISAMQGQCLGL